MEAKKCYIGFLLLFITQSVLAQNVVLSGQVTDAATGEPLVGVTVYHTQRRIGTSTNTTGHYTITLPSGRPLELVFSYVGYASDTQNLTMTGNQRLDIQLQPDVQSLSELNVYGKRHNFGVQSSQMSAIAVSAEQIRKMPVLLGETDVLKSLQRLPGVQSAGDGKAGIYVRGGEQDQNLFTLDGITLYSPEHLQGFTSAINAEVVDDVVLYKGAFPTRYGTRLSSVVDVSLQEGDFEKHRASITAGMLASRFQMDGPLWKGHTSYNIAARVSYFKAIVKPMLEEVIYDTPGQLNNYAHMRYFDINAKLTHRFSDVSKLSAVFYMGHDVNKATPNETTQHREDDFYSDYAKGFMDNSASNHTENNRSNLLGGLLFSHRLSATAYLESALNYSGYDGQVRFTNYTENKVSVVQHPNAADAAQLFSYSTQDENSDYHSKIHELKLKSDITFEVQDRHRLHAGLEVGTINLHPTVDIRYTSFKKTAPDIPTALNIGLGEERYKTEETIKVNGMSKKLTQSIFAAYAEDDYTINSRLSANVGIRLQGYITGGDTHLIIEPRTSMRLMLGNSFSMKVSYARMSQGLHLLSSGNLVNPSEIWLPTGEGMKISTSDQISLGINHDMRKGFVVSVEGYYKWLDNVLDYKEGVSFQNVSEWEKIVAQGRGRAYGVEFMIQKTVGNTIGSLTYTWSKSLRTFDREGMMLNGGREFFANGDHRHNVNVTVTQRLSKNWDFNAAWTYQTGRRASFAITAVSGGMPDEFNAYHPNSRDYGGNPAYHSYMYDYYQDTMIDRLVRMNTYKQRNGYVLPAVHRLDVSLSHHGSIGIGEMICDIGIYNLYNQQNISIVYWGYKNNRRMLRGVCMFPIMPSVSLTLKL